MAHLLALVTCACCVGVCMSHHTFNAWLARPACQHDVGLIISYLTEVVQHIMWLKVICLIA